MARRNKRLSDTELRALCESEITSASAYSADLADERASAMDAYLGEPQGDEVPHRSQVRTREVFDTVEWVLPSLMRVFADADNIVVFEPVGPEDEDAAQQESDACQHIFWKQNRGFFNLYNFLKDGLLSKTGILKIWYDDTPDEEREEYENLTEWELSELFNDTTRELEPLEFEANADGTYSITLRAIRSRGRVRIEPCPPEEFGVARDARSIYPEDADFVYHRTRKSKSELVEMGYDRKMIEELPTSTEDVLTQERLARRYLSDEREDYEHGDHWSMQRVWLTECYIRVDRNGDGISELLKVVLAGQDSNYANGSTLLDVEEVDRQPFVVWSPIVRCHTFYGLSMADMVMDLQSIKTSLTRSVLDSTYLANNGRTAINENVNIDDLLTSRPGGVVRVSGLDQPGASLMPIPAQPVPQEAFQMLEYLDDMRQKRTGVGDEVGALDSNALAQMNTGVAALAYDAARSKIEMMARLCAEIGLRPLFQRVHELLRKSGDKEMSLRLGGQWVQVQPQEWRERADMTVQVGIGQVSRERRLTALSDVLEKQAAAAEGGGMGVLLMPEHMYRAVSDYTRELGLEESLYWMDPKEAPPPPEEPPDYQKAALMLQQGQVEALMQRNQVEAAKVESAERIKMLELQARQEEASARVQLEALQADRKDLEEQRKGAEAEAKTMLDAELRARDQEIAQAEMRMKDAQENAKREVEMYRALLQSGTSMTVEQMRVLNGGEPMTPEQVAQAGENAGESLQALKRQIGELQASMMEQQERERAPKAIRRDGNGLIVAIGDVPVKRDALGMVQSIG